MLGPQEAPRCFIAVDYRGAPRPYFNVRGFAVDMPVLLWLDIGDRIVDPYYRGCRATNPTIRSMEAEINTLLAEAFARRELHWDRDLARWRYILGAPLRPLFPDEAEALRQFRERHR